MGNAASASQSADEFRLIDSIKESKIKFEIEGEDYEIAVSSFEAEEKISAYYEVSMSLVSENKIDPDKVMEYPGVLTVIGISGKRYFHGIINKFNLVGMNGRFYNYEACLVPSLWFALINQDCRIFQKKSVVEIVKEILDEYDITSDEYEFRGIDEQKYKTDAFERRHCVQYRESDLNFISRILEEEGIFYFYEHSKDKHLLVFADANTAFKSINQYFTLEDDVIEYRAYSGQEEETDVVREFYYSRSVCPGTVVHSAYNFKEPNTDLSVNANTETHKEHEYYDYPCNYGENNYGTGLAKIRLEEQKVFEKAALGKSTWPLLMPGMIFSLEGHDFEYLDDTYIIVNAKHKGKQTHVLGEKSGIGGDFSYSNTISVIPDDVPYRPSRLTNKPYMRGMQTATVVGPENQEIYTDPYGRVKVQFHWDRLAKKNNAKEESSCWLRAAQSWGGGGWGTVFIPRVGDEVLVDFLGGDPDWPIIVGSVYNERNKPLYTLPDNMTRTTIKTRSTPKSDGFNELRFEDKAGSEEVYLQGEKDWNILIKNDKGQNVGHDETLEVKNDRTKKVGNNQKETIGNDKTINVTNNHEEEIGSNMKLTVKGNKDETVHSDESQTINGTKTVNVTGRMSTKCESSMMEQVGQSKQTIVGTTYTIQADGGIKIICGGTTIDITPSGMSVNGSNIAMLGKTKIN